MFNRPTVFIIGAGASSEFDMPLGSDLVSRVANAVVPTTASPFYEELRARMHECLGSDCAERLLKAGPRLAAIAPRFKSMDEALHFLSKESDVVQLGKVAISHEIVRAERNSRLYRALQGDEQSARDSKLSWAQYFLGLAISGDQLQNIANLFSNVSIIDFNYDRVLPQFLYWAIQKDLTATPGSAIEALRKLRIYHPYGLLGPLEWENGDTLPFGGQGNLRDVAERIMTYTEEASSPELDRIRAVMDAARVVVVIGFGFHRQNIQMVTATQGSRLAFMTVYAVGHYNHPTVQREMAAALRLHDAPVLYDGNGSSFLKDLSLSISLATSQQISA